MRALCASAISPARAIVEGLQDLRAISVGAGLETPRHVISIASVAGRPRVTTNLAVWCDPTSRRGRTNGPHDLAPPPGLGAALRIPLRRSTSSPTTGRSRRLVDFVARRDGPAPCGQRRTGGPRGGHRDDAVQDAGGGGGRGPVGRRRARRRLVHRPVGRRPAIVVTSGQRVDPVWTVPPRSRPAGSWGAVTSRATGTGAWSVPVRCSPRPPSPERPLVRLRVRAGTSLPGPRLEEDPE